jgi:hypothetical protein
LPIIVAAKEGLSKELATGMPAIEIAVASDSVGMAVSLLV